MRNHEPVIVGPFVADEYIVRDARGRFVAECPGYPIRAARIADALNALDAPPPPSLTVGRTLADVVHERCVEAVRDAGGNQSRAAKVLGIARPTLARHLKASR